MESNTLVGSEVHGFRTVEDLDIRNIMEEAKGRWLRPNEIDAILCNHKYFTVHVKPMKLPKSGTIVLFDRKMLRNFRKDGYNWKKKKDEKTVKEAHEHLKVGNVERIHVYYAHGEDKPTFVRRCYWLLDKSLEHIVLVHYRETQEMTQLQGSSGNSNSNSTVSDPSVTWPLSEESDSAVDWVNYSERHHSMTLTNQEQKLHEINTLEWDELLAPDDSNKITTQKQGFELVNPYLTNIYEVMEDTLKTNKVTPESYGDSFSGHVTKSNSIHSNISNHTSYQTAANSQTLASGNGPFFGGNNIENVGKDGLQAQDSFGRWITCINVDSPDSDQGLESSISNGNQSFTVALTMDNHLSRALDPIFNIIDVSPSWALSTEETKILVVGFFNGGQSPQTGFSFNLACGDTFVPVEFLQDGVFRSIISPQKPGLVNLFLSLDGHTPISQVLTFEFRAPIIPNRTTPLNDESTLNGESDWEEFQLQMRLSHLLFSSSKSLNIFATKVSQSALQEAKAFAQRTSHISDDWIYLTKVIEGAKVPIPQAKDSLFELTLQNRLKEWLLEKVIAGCKITEYDEQGLGVIHLCAILGYTWAVLPFSCSGLSLDYRDKYGWTAIHWAAYYGREKMVAALLTAGAKPNLVTDPTSENRGGFIAADLASRNGFDGLAAYLAEKALVSQFNDMALAGNVSGPLQTTSDDAVNPGEEFNEDELCLKDTLAAYRTAAGAAARIQTAFREHSFKVRKKAVEESNPEMEARNIVAAMKIQHAFRNYETRKKMEAAVRIQHRFQTWKARKNYLRMRHHAVKIQAVYRGFKVRKQYCKLVWSVGILEKAIIRWRLKRKGLRGLQIQSNGDTPKERESDDGEEDFFQASRKQAEDRVERSVVRVQQMFRSKQAQEDYRRMKLEHNKAQLEYEGLLHPDSNMG